MLDDSLCQNQKEGTQRSKKGAKTKATKEEFEEDFLERLSMALRGLEALRGGHQRFAQFVAAERGEETPAAFLNKLAWSMREVGKTFDNALRSIQNKCDHEKHTANWKSPDVRRCTECMYYKS